MNIAIGHDHTAHGLKKFIVAYLIENQHTVTDFSAGLEELPSLEYPVFAEKVANLVAEGAFDRGILLCGTGVGMSLAANKVRGVRAVVCSEPYSAKLSREHNNTNILCLGARVVGEELAQMIVDIWVNTAFIGGKHQKRIDMITEMEEKYLHGGPYA